MSFRKIDHIVYAVQDLDDSIKSFSKLLGIDIQPGGRHLNKGTKNALIDLGDQIYLELIAIDQDNQNVKQDRWMGLDYLSDNKITRWAIKSDNLINDSTQITKYNPKLGQIEAGQRVINETNKLEWKMILPMASPEVELIPFAIDWTQSDFHPCDKLEKKCKLIDINLYSSNPSLYQNLMNALHININILKYNTDKIELNIQSPNGIIKLS